MKRFKDEYVLLIFGIIGIIIGFIPMYRVNGSCIVTLMDYCQGAVPVYIDVFEKLRLSYLPLFFASTVITIVSLPALFKEKYTLHPDIKFMLMLAFIFAQIPLLSTIAVIKSTSYSFTISSVIVSVELTVEPLSARYLLMVYNVSPIMLISIVFLAYHLVTLFTRLSIIEQAIET